MNLVQIINNLLSEGYLDKLTAMVGGDRQKVQSAASVAAPVILSQLARTTSDHDGARRLAEVISSYNARGEHFADDTVLADVGTERGSSWLGSFFGEGALGSMINAISSYARLDASMIRKLMAGMAPAILGIISRQFRGRSVTPDSVAAFFADQRENIEAALPHGLGIPGMSPPQTATVATAPRQNWNRPAPSPEHRTNGSRVLVPLLAFTLLGLGAWWFVDWQRGRTARTPAALLQPERPVRMVRDPVVSTQPDVVHDLQSTFSRLSTTLSDVRDVDSAIAAQPQLANMVADLDDVRANMADVAQERRRGLFDSVRDYMDPVRDHIARIKSMPGLPESLQTTLSDLSYKIEDFAGG